MKSQGKKNGMKSQGKEKKKRFEDGKIVTEEKQ